MAFPNHSQVVPGQPSPYHDRLPPIPKRHTFWIAALLFGTIALIVAGLVLGFWRAAERPQPRLETPELDVPLAPAETPAPAQ